MQREFLACLSGLLLVTTLYVSEQSISASPDSAEICELQQGKVQSRTVQETSSDTGKVINGSESRILIDAPAEKVWQLLDDKENIPKFLTQIKSAKVLHNGETLQTVKTSVKICRLLPAFDYVLCFDRSDKYRKMTFKKTDGCFKELYGCFELTSCGDSTILGYRIFADPGFHIPEFVCKVMRADAKGIMLAIKREAEK